ncbi:MAG TPA: FdtA/QdtA family cupin domain-containing protein [Flavisolibacter sp.]|nr:FdtA/QdtA family cupin domain-containing protein [Flavisolibacter sp.]
MTLKDTRIIQLPKFLDERGNLSFFENQNQIPFTIKRAYWIYDVPGGASRGGHAYKTLHEFIVALSGSFDIVLDDGNEKRTYSLNRSYYGLYVPNMIWRHIENFSTNSLALIVADQLYSADDYIYDYRDFTSINNYK